MCVEKLTTGARRSFSIASLSDSCELFRCNCLRSAFDCCCDSIGGGSGGDGVDDICCLMSLVLTRTGVDSFESRDSFDRDVGVSGTKRLNFGQRKSQVHDYSICFFIVLTFVGILTL